MSVKFYWYAPTSGDGAHIGLKKPEREATLDYIIKIAQTAESLGFEGMLIPVGTPFLDSWLVGSAIVHHTTKFKPLIAFRPGFIPPSISAKMASTIDQFSGGRLLVNVVTGGSPLELAQDGDFTDHDVRYQRTDEFLKLIKDFSSKRSVDHEGDFFHIKNGVLNPPNYNERQLPIYFGGSSDAALDVAAKYADVYLQWGEPADLVSEQIQKVTKKAAEHGRSLEFGIRIHVIVRETEEEAWLAAERLISLIDPEVETRMSTYYKEADSIAQKRMNDLLKGDYRFGKYKWAGIGKVRKGAGTAIVGTPEKVREGLQEYIDIGVNHFILSGFPHLEEAVHFGENVLPLFQRSVTELLGV